MQLPDQFEAVPREIIEKAGKPVAVRVETVDTRERGSTFETLPITGAAALPFLGAIGEPVTVERYKYKAKAFYRVQG